MQDFLESLEVKIIKKCMSPEFIMHIALQKMAAEPTLPVLSIVEPLTMADGFCSICGNILKTIDAGSSHKATNRLLSTIIDWLGKPNLEISVFPVPSEPWLFSHLTFTFSKFVLRYSASIFTNCSRFPYQEETVNQWLTVSTEGVQRDKAVNIMNVVDKDGQIKKWYTAQNPIDNFSVSLEDDFEMFVHGTSYENAKDIIECGINLEKGKGKQDFSSGDGFYLGKSFDEARKWTKTRGHSTSAVLVFRVNKVELRGDENDNGLDLTNPEKKKKWQEVVSQFRSGKPDKKFRKDLNRDYNFIEGPMASLSSKNPRLDYPKQKDGTYQLCVRNDDCAELFDRSLDSVVFFGK